MPGVDKKCVTCHLSACDCYTEKIILVCKELLYTSKVVNTRKGTCKYARDIIKTLNCLNGKKK